LQALREKEKGDWKKLTLAEKKALYRASFAQTLVETEAPTGEWKKQAGIAFVLISIGLWGYMALKAFGKTQATMSRSYYLPSFRSVPSSARVVQ